MIERKGAVLNKLIKTFSYADKADKKFSDLIEKQDHLNNCIELLDQDATSCRNDIKELRKDLDTLRRDLIDKGTTLSPKKRGRKPKIHLPISTHEKNIKSFTPKQKRSYRKRANKFIDEEAKPKSQAGHITFIKRGVHLNKKPKLAKGNK